MPGSFFPAREILADLFSPKGLSGISIGLVAGLMALILQISFAAMIFSGPLYMHAQRAMALTLAGAVVLSALYALFGGFRSGVSFPQDASSAIFAGAAAGMAASLAAADPDTVFITLVAGLMVSTLTTGVLFFLAARLGFAELLRFMPYPVVAGFLAGTGWLLTAGSLEVMTGLPPGQDTLLSFFEKKYLLLWVPGAAYALILFLSMRRWSHFLILPGSLAAALLCFHAALPLAGISMEEARSMGFFFTPFSSSRIWPAFTPADLSRIEWTVILKEAPTLAIIPFITITGLLLNTSGLELASGRDLDLNRELTVNGVANLLAAAAGAPAGYTSISLSMLGFKTGAATRLVGLSAALLPLSALFFGGRILTFFPKALLGGFLLLLGISFISDFILDTRKRMPAADFLIVLAVFAIIGLFGYLQGVLFGLFAAIILFVLRFSRIPALAAEDTGHKRHSTKERSLPLQRLLLENGHRIRIFNLTGYLFFGSVNGIATAVLEKSQHTAPRFLVLDFQRVSGFDVSAVNNFIRLARKLASRGIALVLSAPPDRFEILLRQAADTDLDAAIFSFRDENSALEWCEEEVLKEVQRQEGGQTGPVSREALFDAVSDGLLRDLARQEKVEALLEKISPFVEQKSFEAREMALRSGQKTEAMFFVVSGLIREYRALEGGRYSALRALGPGTFFAEPAVYGSWTSLHAYVAESHTEVAAFSTTAFRRLESRDPATAMETHRLLISGRMREA